MTDQVDQPPKTQTDPPVFISLDWGELVRLAEPNPPPVIKYKFSNGREFPAKPRSS